MVTAFGGRIEIVRQIAAGAYFDAYEANDTLLARPVFLKVSRPSDDRAAAAIIEAHARSWRALARAHVSGMPAILDIGREDGRWLLVAEWIAAPSLRALLASEPISVADRDRFLPALLESSLVILSQLHERGFIHGDISPGNILVDPRRGGTVTLVDPAPRLDLPDPHDAARRLILGSPGFCAPEVLAGGPASISADLFALGAVVAAAAQRLRIAPPDLVERLTEPRPGRRPETAAEALSMLHRGSGGPILSAGAPASPPPVAPRSSGGGARPSLPDVGGLFGRIGALWKGAKPPAKRAAPARPAGPPPPRPPAPDPWLARTVPGSAPAPPSPRRPPLPSSDPWFGPTVQAPWSAPRPGRDPADEAIGDPPPPPPDPWREASVLRSVPMPRRSPEAQPSAYPRDGETRLVSVPGAAADPGSEATVAMSAPLPPTPDKGPRATADFSVIAPGLVQAGRHFVVEVWVAPSGERPAMLDQALRGGRMVERGARSHIDLERDTMINVILKLPDFEVPDPIETMGWNGDIRNVGFIVKAPASLAPGLYPGAAKLMQGQIPFASLLFDLEVASAEGRAPDTAGPLSARIQIIARAFASYASLDRAEVLRRVQGIQAAGTNVFLDIVSLRSGSNWEPTLFHEIDASDGLFLFWSRNAAKSPWVEREWRYALERRGLEFINPLALEDPRLVEPPNELKSKHFNDMLLAFIKMEETFHQDGGG